MTGAAGAKLPNIVFIMADDLGYGDLGSYPNPTQRKRIETPNLDRFASEGMRFVDNYAGYSVCAPSRNTLMTGRHVGHFGSSDLTDTTPQTIATLLRDQGGYDTALIGKWGLDGNPKAPNAPGPGYPTKQGFMYFQGQSNQWQCHDYFPPFQSIGDANVTIEQNAGASPETCGDFHADCAWTGDLWTDAAVGYVRNHSTSDKPFFLYLAYTTPHAGSVGSVEEVDVPAPLVNESVYYNLSGWPSVEQDFANAITSLDARVGIFMSALKDAGLDDDTIVFFSSDNGAHQEGGHSYQFLNSSGYLRGFKRSIHDGGHRAAMLVRWPGRVPAGVTSWQQTAFYDFFPTAADIANINLDLDKFSYIDGYSVLPTLLKGDGAQPQPEFIYHDFPNCLDPAIPDSVPRTFGQNIRYGNWSGVCIGKDTPCTGNPPGVFYLYDMAQDPGQSHDVAAKHPQIVEKLRSIMAEQHNASYMV